MGKYFNYFMYALSILLTIFVVVLLVANLFFGYEASNKTLTLWVLVSLLPRITIDLTKDK